MLEPDTANYEPRMILPHQQKAFDDLVATAKVCFTFPRKSAPVQLKTATLIVSPSGAGKTFLAAAVAAEMAVPYCHVSVADWVIMGSSARGGAVTLAHICSFLRSCRNRDGAVIMIDEIDKLGGGAGGGNGSTGSSAWCQFLRLEAFQLLDLRLPSNLVDGESDMVSPMAIAEAMQVLQHKTLILAAGAFQDLWDNRARPAMGFLPSEATDDPPDLLELSTRLPKELVARFRSKIVVLPPLKERDYHQMLEQTAAKVPAALRQTFIRLGRQRAVEALRLQQGARFLEELLLDTILAERAELVNCRKESFRAQLSSDGIT